MIERGCQAGEARRCLPSEHFLELEVELPTVQLHQLDSVWIGEIDDESHAFGIERINPTSTINILHYARVRKTGYELECLRSV